MDRFEFGQTVYVEGYGDEECVFVAYLGTNVGYDHAIPQCAVHHKDDAGYFGDGLYCLVSHILSAIEEAQNG